jgi:hypothetical protein
MTDIFISYAREDEGRIKEFVSALEQQGWSAIQYNNNNGVRSCNHAFAFAFTAWLG